jgi:hypothetical protein
MTPGDLVGATIPPSISDARVNHILYGDKHGGGGHLHGMNLPCKSEFPAEWDAKEVISIVMKDAANNGLDWHQERNGNYVADAQEGKVIIRIVENRSRTEIITAYPLNTPRNPCPYANDNGD